MWEPDYLDAFLNLLWLRPESAVLCACHARVLGRYLGLRPPDRLAEFCCGDGTFSFLLLGGRLSPDWDAFQATAPFRQTGGTGSDIFDHFDESYQPRIGQPARWPVDLGLDLRRTMLERARMLGHYRELKAADLAAPLALDRPPFDTVLLLQSINHLPDPEQAARNLHAATGADGVAYVTTYDPSLCALYARLDQQFAPEWVGLVERDMRRSWPALLPVAGWTRLFSQAGFRSVDVIPLLHRSFAPAWNVGLRPIAPLLIRMRDLAGRRDEQALANLKREWVELFRKLASPFVAPATRVDEAVTHLYVLSRR